MLLNEEDNSIVIKILNKDYRANEKSSSLKKVSTILNKIRSNVSNLDSLLTEFGGTDVSKFQADIIEILLSDLKLPDVPKLFIIFVYLSEEYPGFQDNFFLKIFELLGDNSPDLLRLKIISKFFLICLDYDKCNFHSLDKLLGYTLDISYADLNLFLNFFVKISSQSLSNENLRTLLSEKFKNIRFNLLSEIRATSKRIDSLIHKMRFIYENKGDLSQSICEEFIQINEKFDTEKSLFLKLGGADYEIPLIIMDGLIIGADHKIKFTDSPLLFTFDSKEEEDFYFSLDKIYESKTLIKYVDEEILTNLLLTINSVDDSDSVFTTLKDHIKPSLTLILNALLKCCKLSNQRIPLLCRVMSQFSRIDDNFKIELNSLVLSQLNSLLKVKGSASGLRFRICTVICELVKFKVVDLGSLYRFLFTCAEYLSSNSIEMICIIMENCGRILCSVASDKRFLNFINLLRQKSDSDDKPINFYKITHILSFFEGANPGISDHTEIFEKYCFIISKLGDGGFFALPKIVVYDSLLFICQHINIFTANDLQLIRTYFNSSDKSIFYLFLEIIEDQLHYCLLISDLKNHFSLCLFLLSVSNSTLSYNSVLSIFTEILNNFLTFNDSFNEFLLILIDELSLYFSDSTQEVKKKWNSLRSKILVQDAVSTEDTALPLLLNSTPNEEFEYLLSSTIKGEMNSCLTRRPSRKGLKVNLGDRNSRFNNNLVIITHKLKNP
jgi:hypothetical protein